MAATDQGSRRDGARRIAVAAMFVALSLVAAMLPTLPGSAFKFAGFPLLLAGMLVGPRTGFAIGCLTDLIGFAIRPTGWFFPGFTLTQGLTSMIPGLMTRGVEPMSNKPLDEGEGPELFPSDRAGVTIRSYFRLLFIFGLTQVITSVLMVSVFTSKIVVGTPLLFELTTRAIAQSIHVPIYAFLALAILRRLSETESYVRLLKARR